MWNSVSKCYLQFCNCKYTTSSICGGNRFMIPNLQQRIHIFDLYKKWLHIYGVSSVQIWSKIRGKNVFFYSSCPLRIYRKISTYQTSIRRITVRIVGQSKHQLQLVEVTNMDLKLTIDQTWLNWLRERNCNLPRTK